MSKKREPRPMSFRRQVRQSMDDLRSIMERGQSPSGDGRFTVRTVEVVEPGKHDASSIRRIRASLNLSQALFAQLVGVSPALVRAWELGTREPAPVARRLLDRVRAEPAAFSGLVKRSNGAGRAAPSGWLTARPKWCSLRTGDRILRHLELVPLMTLRIFTALVTILVLVVLGGAEPATKPLTEPAVSLTRRFDVRGIVTDTLGKPIADADVAWLLPPSSHANRPRQLEELKSVRTGADGRFDLRDVGAMDGVAVLRASATGRAPRYLPVYAPAGSSTRVLFSDINGKRLAEPWLVLLDGAPLRGVVVDEDGKPVVGARVGEYYRERPAITDAQGRFAIEDFPKLGSTVGDGLERAPLVEGDDIVRQWCREPQDNADDVRLVVHRGGVIEGRVVEYSTGKPVPRASVSANTRGSQLNLITTNTDEEGRYRIRTFDGDVRVAVIPPHPEYRKPPLDGRQWIATEPSATVPLKKGAVVTDVDFVLRPALMVAGVVRTTDGDAPPVLLDVDVSWSDAAGHHESSVAHVTTKPDGSFELQKLPGGRFMAGVTLHGNPLAHVGHQEFEIENWEDFRGLEIRLSGDPEDIERLATASAAAAATAVDPAPATAPTEAAALRGRVVDQFGAPVPLARVMSLDPEMKEDVQETSLRDQCFSDLDGAFELKLPDRSHPLIVFAWDPHRETACGVRLEPGWGDAPQELRLSQKTSRIVGRVCDEKDAPVAGVPVKLFFNQELAVPRRLTRERILSATVTDEHGHYEIAGYIPPPGGLPLRLSSGRRQSEMYNVDESRHYGIAAEMWYSRFPVAPGEALTEVDFIQDRSTPGKVAQTVTREDLATRREH